MMVCSMIYGIYFMGSVKSAAGDNLADDNFTSLIGTIASLMGILRFTWSIGLMNFNFKANYALLMSVQIVIAFAAPLILEIGDKTEYISLKKATYSVSSILTTLMQGGHYVLYPVILNKMYGTEGGLLAFSVAFTFQGVASLLNLTLIKTLATSDSGLDKKPLDFKSICFIYGSLNVFALGLLIFCYKGSKTQN